MDPFENERSTDEMAVRTSGPCFGRAKPFDELPSSMFTEAISHQRILAGKGRTRVKGAHGSRFVQGTVRVGIHLHICRLATSTIEGGGPDVPPTPPSAVLASLSILPCTRGLLCGLPLVPSRPSMACRHVPPGRNPSPPSSNGKGSRHPATPLPTNVGPTWQGRGSPGSPSLPHQCPPLWGYPAHKGGIGERIGSADGAWCCVPTDRFVGPIPAEEVGD